MAWALWVLAFATGIALFAVSIEDFSRAAADREGIAKAAGGVLLLLGSYFAARNLRQSFADQRANRALKAIDMLANDQDAKVQKAGAAVLRSLMSPEEKKRHPHEEVQAMIDAVAKEFGIVQTPNESTR